MKMRFFFVLMCGLLLTSCGKQLSGLATELQAAPDSFSFDASGGEGKAYVVCDGFWNVYTNDRDWIDVHIFGSNGNDSVSFTVAENPTAVQRIGFIVFNAGIDLSDTVTVLQEACGMAAQ